MHVAGLTTHPDDWPTFRADNACSASTSGRVAARPEPLWGFDLGISTVPGLPRITAPVAAGGLVFVGGADGVVRAINASSGTLAWKGYTGGAIRMPPTIWEDRAYVGSGDGWVYCFEAESGRLLWRFRAAPAERILPVYGTLMSTWPVAAGVLVEDGTAYTAAGIANYDGTYVYALDARTGVVKWQNNTSGHLDPQARTGVSVQGHLLLHDGKLYLPGGTSISPAVYNATTGECLNDPGQLAECLSRSPRGWELSLLGDEVVACGKPFYGHPAYDVYDATVFSRAFLASAGNTSVVWASDGAGHRVMGFSGFDREGLARNAANPGNRFEVNWARLAPSTKPDWSLAFQKARAMAVCRNAVLLATDRELVAMDPTSGVIQWRQPLPTPPVPWGLAVDGAGRVVTTLIGGRVLCFGPVRMVGQG